MSKLHDVTESLYSDASTKVDRSAKVIRDVKVLGFDSINTPRVLGLTRNEVGDACDKPYAYDRKAVEAAIALYEGAAVNIDHPKMNRGVDGSRKVDPSGREVAARFGRLRNVRIDETGLRADLEYLESHPAAAQILEMAERMPEQIALSHHAQCVWDVRDGRLWAVEIKNVRSVDLIGDRPGTTRGLFESADPSQEVPQMKTVKAVMESVDAKSPLRKLLAKAIEMDGEIGEMPMEPPVAESSPDQQLADAIKGMVNSVLEDTSLDLGSKLAKIKEILKAHEALTATPEKPADTGESKEGESSESADAVAIELARLKKERETERKVRSAIESKGIRASEVQVRACVALESEADRVAYINELAERSQPVTRSGRVAVEAHDDDFDDYVPDAKKVAAALR